MITPITNQNEFNASNRIGSLMKKVSFATKYIFSFIILFTLFPIASNAQGIWDDGGADGLWSTAANWDDDNVPNGIAVSIGDGFVTTVDAGFSNSILSLQVGGGVDGSVTLATDLTVTGSISINSGATFDDGGNTLNLGGDFTKAGTFTSSGTINFNGNGAQSIDNDGPFNSFQVNKSGGTLTANSDITTNGAINITAGTFTLNGFNLIANSTTTVDGGTLTFTSGNHVYGNTFTLSSGTVNAGSGTQGLYILAISGGTYNSESATHNFSVTNVAGSNTTTSTTVFNKTSGTFNGGTAQFIIATSRTNTAPNATAIRNSEAIISSNSSISFYQLKHNGATEATTTGFRRLTFSGNSTISVSNQYERTGNTTATQLNGSTSLDLTGATLLYTVSTVSLSISNEWPSSNGPTNVTYDGTLGLTLPSSTARTIPSGGTFTHNATATLTLSSTLTINGTYIRQKTTSLVTGTISYGTGSTLNYNITTPGAVSGLVEWAATNPPENVTINNSGNTVTATNSKTINGTLTITAGTLSAGSNNITVLGNVIGSDIAGSGTIADATTLVLGDNSTPANSTQDQTISGTIILNKLTINKTGQGGGITDNLVTVNGTIRVTASSTITITNGTLQLTADGKLSSKISESNFGTLSVSIASGGKLITGGQALSAINSISASSGTIEFDGTGAESLPTGITIGTLIVNNNSGVSTSSGTLTVSNGLTLTNGIITTTSSNILRLGSSATISGTPSSSKMILGPLQKAFAIGDASAFTFPIGFTSTYLPAIFDYSANSVGTSIIEIEAKSGGPGGTAPSGISVVAGDHYYTVKEVGTGGTFTYDITLTYTGTGLNPDARNKILRQTGATPTYQFDAANNGTASGGTITLSSQTALPTNSGIFAFGSGGATVKWDNTSTDGLWLTATNWDGDVVPGSEDDVVIDNTTVSGSFTVLLDSTVAQTIKTLVIGQDGANVITLNITNTNSTPLTISGTGTALNVNQDGVLTINGTSGGISLSNSGDINFDNLSVYNVTTGTGITTSGTRTFGATSTTNIASDNGLKALTYGHLNLSATSASLTTGTISVQGNFAVTSGSTTLSSSAILSVTGTTTISNGATLDLAGTGNKTFTGSVTNSGDLNLSGTSGTITFNGAYSGTGTIDATGANPAISFNSTFNPSGSTTFGSQSLTFNSTITLNGGTFTPSSNTDLQNGVTSFTFNGGSIGSTTGRPLVFDKSNGSQTIAVTSGTGAFQELTINNSNNVSGSNDFSVNGVLTLISGTLAMGSNTLTLGSSGSNLGTLSGTGTISGNFTRWFAASTVSNVRFPLISGGNDRLVNLSYTSAPSAGTVTAAFISSSPGDGGLNITDGAYTISTITNDGYWSVTSSIGGTYSLDLNAPGFGGITNDASVQFLHLIRRNTAATNWSVDGTHSAGTGTSSLPVIHRTGMTLYGEVTIGSNLSDNSLPVEMVSFSAKTTYDMVKLNWTTETESNNSGFIILRKSENSADFVPVTNSLVKSKNSTSANLTKYEFVDKSDLEEGVTYTYKIRSVDLGGQVHDYKLSSEVTFTSIPKELILNQNYPNPFNPTTTFEVFLPKDVKISVDIYNILGQNIRTLYSGEKEKGLHTFLWDGKDKSQKSVSSGVYFYQVITPDGQKLKKMTLMK